MSTRTSKSVPTGSNKSKTNPAILSYPPILYGGESILNRNYVDDELQCLICMSTVKDPVHLACGMHSLCFGCISKFWEYQKVESFGYRSVFCPRCGDDSGALRVRKPEHFKVNRELERFRRAYDREKSLWINEKIQLETQLNCIQKKKEEEKTKGKKSGKKSAKKGLSDEEEKKIKQLLGNFSEEQLKEVNKLFMESIAKKEKGFVTPPKKSESKKSSPSEIYESDESGSKRKGSSIKKVSTSQRRTLVYSEKTKESKGYALKKEKDSEKKSPSSRSLKKLKTERN